MNPLRLHNRRAGTRKDHNLRVNTLCQECPVRCGLTAYLKNGRVVDIHGEDTHPVSRGRLCARGLAFVQGLDSPYRFIVPAFRKKQGEPFSPQADWEKALDNLAEHLRKTKDQYGPQSIAIGCDPESDLDFALGALHFAHLLGTPHIYPTPHQGVGLLPPSPVHPCTSWTQRKSLFLIEADPASSHPVLMGWVLEAQQQGAKIIAADPRFTRTLAKADLALRIRPGAGNFLGLALLKMVLEESDLNTGAVKARFSNLIQWPDSLDNLSWEDLETTLGLSYQSLEPLKDLWLKNDPATIITGKTLAPLPGYDIWPVLPIILKGSGRSDPAWYPLTGTFPPLLFQGPLEPSKEGEDFLIKAVLCSGEGFADRLSPVPAESLDLMAWFGSFPTRIQQSAHWIFPAALWPEKTSLSLSLDRTAQWSPKILEPGPDCRTGLDFWTGLAKRFGWQEAFPWIREDGTADPETFYRWVLENSPFLRGCEQIKDFSSAGSPVTWSVEELNQQASGEEWPILEIDFPKPQQLLYAESDPFPLIFQKTPFVSRTDPAGGFWPWTQNLEDEKALQIHPETAGVLGINNGEIITITGPIGSGEGVVWINRMVPRGMVSSPGIMVGDRVLVHKQDQTPEEALTLLRDFLL